MFTSDFICSQK